MKRRTILVLAGFYLAGSAVAEPLPFPDGKYVTDLNLCQLTGQQMVQRFGDRVGAMVRNINGDKLDNSYELSCTVDNVKTSDQLVQFRAICDSEGDKTPIQGAYRIVSPTSFQLGERTFQHCQQVGSDN